MQYVPPLGATDPNASYVEGNPLAGLRGSFPTAPGYEGMMREIVNAISTFGLSPDPNNLSQLGEGVVQGIQSCKWLYAGLSTNIGNAFSVTLTPTPPALPVGMTLSALMNAAPTGAATLIVNGTTLALQRRGGAPLIGGEWSAGDLVDFEIRAPGVAQVAGLTINDVGAIHTGTAAGTAAALTVANLYPPLAAYNDLTSLLIRCPNGVGTGATVALNGLAPVLILRNDGTPIQFGDVPTGGDLLADIVGGNVQLIGFGLKQVPRILTGNTFYIRSDGNDGNDGSANTAAKAFLTPQGAVNYLTGNFVTTGQSISLVLGIPGTYPAPLYVNDANFTLTGDATNQANYILTGSGPAGGNGAVTSVNSGSLILVGVTVQNTGTLNATLSAGSGGSITLANCSVGSTGTVGGGVFVAGPGGSISFGSGCHASGNAVYLFLASGGQISLGNVPFTVDGNPAYGVATAYSHAGGEINASAGASIVGTARGQRYLGDLNGIFNTAGAGATFFPGNSPGTLVTDAQYG